MKARKIALWWLLAALLGPSLLIAGTGPRIQFDAVEHDFGDVIHGESPSVELTCTNTGDDELILDRIDSSCGCAKAVRGSKRMPPGSSSKIFAQIETMGMQPGRHAKTIAIHSNDPEHPKTELKLVFDVIRHVVITPDFVATRASETQDATLFSLKATSHFTHPITLKAAKSDTGPEFALIPQEIVVPPGGTADFQISVRMKWEQGQSVLKGTAVIHTDDKVEELLPVRYFIHLSPTPHALKGRNEPRESSEASGR